jgi:hypothetical protein
LSYLGSTNGTFAIQTPGSGYSDKYTIASDGTATWYVGGSEAMRLNSTGLGVGVSPSAKLHVQGASAQAIFSVATATDARHEYYRNSVLEGLIGWDANTMKVGAYQSSGKLELWSGGSAKATLDASGNVGIGVTPSATDSTYFQALEIARVGQGLTAAKNALTGSPSSWLSNNSYATYSSGVVWNYAISQPAAQYRLFEGQHQWFNAPSGTAGNAITFTQAMTLTAAGELLVGTTASGGQNGFCVLRPLSGGVVATTAETAHNFGALTGSTYATFLYATTAIGSITQNGTTGVLYNINSDYRLKESVAPLSGGLARVNELKPSIYKWKSDGSSGEGFLAHELAEVVPFAVTGEKDAVNEDGSIKSQGIDMSRVVPILVAAIQELTARVQTLETR